MIGTEDEISDHPCVGLTVIGITVLCCICAGDANAENSECPNFNSDYLF